MKQFLKMVFAVLVAISIRAHLVVALKKLDAKLNDVQLDAEASDSGPQGKVSTASSKEG